MTSRFLSGLFFSFLTVLVIGGVFYSIDLVFASFGPADLPLKGYVWGADNGQGVGFISFCGGQGTPECPGSSVEYQVVIDNNTGIFRGYAWSPNFGWLSFNKSETQSPPYPPFNSGESYIAKIDPTNPGEKQMEGWGRFLSACDFIDGPDADSFPDQCASSGPGANSGGWDGWVNFSSGTATDGNYYRGFVATSSAGAGYLSGYAWGSDNVGVIEASTSPAFLQPPRVPLPQISVNLTASPVTGKVPLGVTLTATVTTNTSSSITYKFFCDEGGKNRGSSTIDTFATTASFQCIYSVADSYKPAVEVYQDGVFAKAANSSYLTNAGPGQTIQAKPGIIIEIAPDE